MIIYQVNILSLIFVLTILPIGAYASMVSNLYSRDVLAILSENGTCTDGTQKKSSPSDTK